MVLKFHKVSIVSLQGITVEHASYASCVVKSKIFIHLDVTVSIRVRDVAYSKFIFGLVCLPKRCGRWL